MSQFWYSILSAAPFSTRWPLDACTERVRIFVRRRRVSAFPGRRRRRSLLLLVALLCRTTRNRVVVVRRQMRVLVHILRHWVAVRRGMRRVATLLGGVWRRNGGVVRVAGGRAKCEGKGRMRRRCLIVGAGWPLVRRCHLGGHRPHLLHHRCLLDSRVNQFLVLENER